MVDIALRVENLGKKYRLGKRQTPYRTIREQLITTFTAPFRRLRKSDTDIFWALKDVCFEVSRGEVVGIIGRNGAGKSTLLKILSKVVTPTTGRAEIYGRLGSLLEVGTGFHPELTGRENIYLNGAILGMKKSEIERRFDEIVAFSEIEEFLDTPVKHYSSGMYVRLAFAVGAHLEPEVLLVDEVLAVGDVAFQQKCLGKMNSVSQAGRTVLFVSHNMAAVQQLCQKAYLLDRGRVIASGDTMTVVETYYKTVANRDNAVSESRNVPLGTVRFLNWQLSQSDTGSSHSCFTGELCTFKFQLASRRTVSQAYIGMHLRSKDGTLVWAARSRDYGRPTISLQEGLYDVVFLAPQLPLRPDFYEIFITINEPDGNNLDSWHAQPKLQVLPKNETSTPQNRRGLLDIENEFKLLRTEG